MVLQAHQCSRLCAGGLDDYAEMATIGLLNYSTIRNGFFLGQTEFRDLAGPVDWKELEQLGLQLLSSLLCAFWLPVWHDGWHLLQLGMTCAGDKGAVICNPHDTWFSQRSWEEMWMEVPKVKVCTLWQPVADCSSAAFAVDCFRSSCVL